MIRNAHSLYILEPHDQTSGTETTEIYSEEFNIGATSQVEPIIGENFVEVHIGSTIMKHLMLVTDILDEYVLGLDIMEQNYFHFNIRKKIVKRFSYTGKTMKIFL